MKLFDLSGKTAIVTGAASGLGNAIAEGLHEAGAEVVIIDIRDDVYQVAQKMGGTGPLVHAVQGDLFRREDVKRAFEDSVHLLGGKLDILVNNAGIVIRHFCEDYPMDDWDKVMEINVNAAFLLSQLAGKIMLPRGKGKIINMASMLSFTGGFRVAAYAASKGAVAILTKSLGNEWASKGINVNAIAPGYMDTELNAALKADPQRSEQILARIPAARWGKPEDLKGVVVFLASAASDYLSGAIIPVDGGFLSR
jgi:2-deoxy-D-gluconate 3-dehydrogenase